MIRLFHDEALGNQEGKLNVGVSGRLDPVIEFTLHHLPDGPTGRFEDDAAAYHLRYLGHISFTDDIEVPLVIVVRPGCNDIFWHGRSLMVDIHAAAPHTMVMKRRLLSGPGLPRMVHTAFTSTPG